MVGNFNPFVLVFGGLILAATFVYLRYVMYLAKNLNKRRNSFTRDNIDFEPELPESLTDTVISNHYFGTSPSVEEIPRTTSQKPVSPKILKGDLKKGDHVKVVKKRGGDIDTFFLSYNGPRKIVQYWSGGIHRRTNVVRA